MGIPASHRLLPLLLLTSASTPAFGQSGGPDAGGYVYGPVAYQFVSIAGTGTNLGLPTDGSANVTLPFAFPFYGNSYTTVSVSANGALSFVSGRTVPGNNLPLPATGANAPDIAVFWDWMAPSQAGAVYVRHQSGAGRYVISWENVPHLGSASGGSFQVHLYPSGAMRFHYADTTFGNSIFDLGASATIGVQDAVGLGLGAGRALMYSYNQPVLPAGTALYIGPCGGDIDGDGAVSSACGGLDCDDFDAGFGPSVPDVCNDSIDQDCDGADDQPDADGDGLASPVCGGNDCDDTDATVFPGGIELCGDGVDNDCSGSTPDVFDGDGDGSLCTVDCDDTVTTIRPGAIEVCSDGVDQDCSGSDLPADGDGDGDPSLACGGGDCADGNSAVSSLIDGDNDGADACADCNDGSAAIGPGQPEACDGVDADCDGLADGLDVDVGSPAPILGPVTANPSMTLDGSTSGQTVFPSPLGVVAAGTVVDVDVTVALGHNAPGQITLALQSPSGTVVTLMAGIGGVGSPFGVPTFDDEASMPIASASPQFNGSFIPQGSLAAFDGEGAYGPWTLIVTDSVPASADGTLFSWTLGLTTQPPFDGDGDGWGDVCQDCAASDGTIYPGATEVCDDSIDQDCDGIDTVSDADGDGFAIAACGGNDCDDTDISVNPLAVEVCADTVDNDCSPLTLDAYDFDGDGSTCDVDCDDADAQRGTTLPELCNDGIDNDCDAATPDIFDGDGDGWACDSDCVDDSPTAYPGAPELLCNGVEDDCDAGTAPDVDDGDGDGSDCDVDCDDLDATSFPGAGELVCDGVDQACNGLGNEADGDGDGFQICEGDCADGDPTTYPLAAEICTDGIDNDCDGSADETSDRAYDLDDSGAVTIELCTTSFPFCGSDRSLVTVHANGRLTFGSADGSATGSLSDLFAEAPQIAVLWADHDPSLIGEVSVLEDTGTGEVVIDWSAVPPAPSLGLLGASTFSVTLRPDGTAAADWGGIAVVDALVGFACEGASAGNAESVDVDAPVPSGALGVGRGTETAWVEVFSAASPPDLAGFAADLCLTAGVDADGDGWTDVCGDCDDAAADTNPGAPELCDGDDHDCNGVPLDADLDGDGEIDEACGGADCDDLDADVIPGHDEICDGKDNDCDGAAETGFEDQDGDGYRLCAEDCDDSDPDSFPGNPEVCDGADNDCNAVWDDGFTPDADADGYRALDCDGDDCDDTDPEVRPDAIEVCDGVDQDCDGDADDVDLDGDGHRPDACGGDDCNDLRVAVNPDGTEACNGLDDDCNGVDDDVDLDGDGRLDFACGGDDCNDGDAAVAPGADEICGDEIDEDCDGEVDDDCGCDCGSPDGASFLPLLLLPLFRRRR